MSWFWWKALKTTTHGYATSAKKRTGTLRRRSVKKSNLGGALKTTELTRAKTRLNGLQIQIQIQIQVRRVTTATNSCNYDICSRCIEKYLVRQINFLPNFLFPPSAEETTELHQGHFLQLNWRKKVKLDQSTNVRRLHFSAMKVN